MRLMKSKLLWDHLLSKDIFSDVINDIQSLENEHSNILCKISYDLLGPLFVKEMLKALMTRYKRMLILVESSDQIDLYKSYLSEYNDIFEIDTLSIISTKMVKISDFDYVLKLGNHKELGSKQYDSFLRLLGKVTIVSFVDKNLYIEPIIKWRSQPVYLLEYSESSYIGQQISISKIKFVKSDYQREERLSTQILHCFTEIEKQNLKGNCSVIVIEDNRYPDLIKELNNLLSESEELFTSVDIFFEENYQVGLKKILDAYSDKHKVFIISLEVVTTMFGISRCQNIFNLAMSLTDEQVMKLFYFGFSLDELHHQNYIFDFSNTMQSVLDLKDVNPEVIDRDDIRINLHTILKRDSIPMYNDDSADNGDLLGVLHDVKIIKHLISNKTSGAISVGVIGEWGSGKSFFIDKLYKEISNDYEIKSFLQVRFNAWHYSDTQVVLSLGNEIFNKVRQNIDSTNDVKIICKEYVDSIEQEINVLNLNIENIDKKLTNVENNIKKSKAEIDEYTLNEITRNINVEDRYLLERILIKTKNISDYLSNLHDKKIHKKTINIIKMLFQLNKKPFIKISLLSIFILILFISKNPKINFFAEVKNILKFTSVTSVLLVIHGAVNFVESILSRLSKLNYLQEEKKREVNSQNELFNLKMETQKKLLLKQEEKNNAQNQDYLSYLLNEKVSQRRYEEHLSYIHNLRHDMNLLNEYLRNYDKDNRKLILYIDDLDRCPPKQVIQVLEAVHLLMSFDRFAVVLAADMNWISRCLYQEHMKLNNTGNEHINYAYEYMEKIFQVYIKPIVIKEHEIDLLVDGLMISEMMGKNNNPTTENIQFDDKDLHVSQDRGDIKKKSVVDKKIHQSDKKIESDFEILNNEKVNIKNILHNETITPRKVKRYINIFQIIKASYHLNDYSNTLISLLALKIFKNEQYEILLNFSMDNEKKKESIDEKFHDLLSIEKNIIISWSEVVERYTFAKSMKINN